MTDQSPWKLLDIDPTTEARLIKRAYAKKLKLSPPESDPEYFKLLHQAYQDALRLSKKGKIEKVTSVASSNADATSPSSRRASFKETMLSRRVSIDPDVNFEEDIGFEHKTTELERLIDSITCDSEKVKDWSNWRSLLSAELLAQDKYFDFISGKILRDLSNNAAPDADSVEVYEVLNFIFRWSQKLNSVRSELGDDRFYNFFCWCAEEGLPRTSEDFKEKILDYETGKLDDIKREGTLHILSYCRLEGEYESPSVFDAISDNFIVYSWIAFVREVEFFRDEAEESFFLIFVNDDGKVVDCYHDVSCVETAKEWAEKFSQIKNLQWHDVAVRLPSELDVFLYLVSWKSFLELVTLTD